MNAGVTSSGSPNQKASTSGSPSPAFATSRICDALSARTAGRAVAGAAKFRFVHEEGARGRGARCRAGWDRIYTTAMRASRESGMAIVWSVIGILLCGGLGGIRRVGAFVAAIGWVRHAGRHRRRDHRHGGGRCAMDGLAPRCFGVSGVAPASAGGSLAYVRRRRTRDRLIAAYDAARTIAPITDEAADFDVAAAYAVLAEIERRRREQGWVPAGRKIGFTNRTIWPRYGVYDPIWAHTWTHTVHHAVDGHATLAIGRFCAAAHRARSRVRA